MHIALETERRWSIGAANHAAGEVRTAQHRPQALARRGRLAALFGALAELASRLTAHFSQPAQKRRVGCASKVLADGPLLMNPEALAQSPLENLPGAALGKLTC